jgi:hypothetical protein
MNRRTTVASLPAGCVSTPIGGVVYFHCGSDYYKPAYQGNTLVYTTTAPPR